jgi:hypothetical protein
MSETTPVASDAATAAPAAAPASVPQTPASETGSPPADGQPQGETDADEGRADTRTPEQKADAARQRRITKLERNNARLHMEREQLARDLAAARQGQQQTTEQPQGEGGQQITREDFERVTRDRAAQMRQAEKLGESVDGMIERGRSGIDGFDAKVLALAEELPLYDMRTNSPTPALLALVECDAPEKVIAYLGENPDVAAELADLSPTRLARRLAQIEQQVAKPQSRLPSSAPKPLEPVKPAAASSVPDPAKDPAGWRKWRNETAKV